MPSDWGMIFFWRARFSAAAVFSTMILGVGGDSMVVACHRTGINIAGESFSPGESLPRLNKRPPAASPQSIVRPSRNLNAAGSDRLFTAAIALQHLHSEARRARYTLGNARRWVGAAGTHCIFQRNGCLRKDSNLERNSESPVLPLRQQGDARSTHAVNGQVSTPSEELLALCVFGTTAGR